MDNTLWSDWYLLESKLDVVNVPDLSGIYEIRTDYEFGRLKGSSQVVYIGSAAGGSKPSLKVRLMDQRAKNPCRYLTRTEKLLKEAGHTLEFRFLIAHDGITAKHTESEKLTAYEKEHWELPPGNGVLPRASEYNINRFTPRD